MKLGARIKEYFQFRELWQFASFMTALPILCLIGWVILSLCVSKEKDKRIESNVCISVCHQLGKYYRPFQSHYAGPRPYATDDECTCIQVVKKQPPRIKK